MHYFIDGYNLMFRVLRAGDDLQMQRESIIRDLSRKIILTGLDVTIVFDAQYQSGESSRSNLQHLEIHFTSRGETADEYILQQLKHEKKPLQQTIVTSDKKLAWLARRQGSKTETVEDFLRQLNNRYRNKQKRPAAPISNVLLKPKKAITAPPEKSSPEESFDYYLAHFEDSFKKIIESQPANQNKEVISRKKPRATHKAIKQDDGLSIVERWIKAFERNLENEEK